MRRFRAHFNRGRLLAAILCFSPILLFGQDGPRERICIDNDWRFQKGDPAGVDTFNLLYDIRPKPHTKGEPVKPADFTEAAEKVDAATHPVLKPWILPTANAFIKDPSQHHLMPDGNPGDGIPFAQRDFDDSGWRQLDLPHDWAIEGPFNSGGVSGGMGKLPSPGVGWYRKQLNIPASDTGKCLYLDVDGAMSYAAVWINGKLAGGWPYGYASWRVDLTPYIVPGGTNELAIRLDNPPDFSRWYPGAGIYRNVWLTKTSPVHVGQWGTYLTTPEVSKSSATINLAVTIDNASTNDASVSVSTAIYALDSNGKRTGSPVANIVPSYVTVSAGQNAIVNGSVALANPRLWGPPPQQKPNRYIAIITVTQNGQVVDNYETRFGIRSLEFKPDGVYVNGQRIYLKGVNDHSDLGALGMVFNGRAAERQLEELRDMGCNAIRMSHNPPAPELLELTDRMGFLVLDEIFDCWYRQKTPFDFHLIFPDWHEPDLRAFMQRDRNHPSVFLWSVGNEVGEQFTGDDGAKVGKQLLAIAHDEDATRPITASMNFAAAGSPFADVWDVISLNYQGAGIRTRPGQYPAFHTKYPTQTILSTESAAALSTRGEYLFPVTTNSSSPVKDGHGGNSSQHVVSSYELYAADFGSSPDRVFKSQDENPFVAGEFVWSGWDYLGEPTPYYSSRSSYFGIIDLAGFQKDRFYLYQAEWRPDFPMAHILPQWTWPDRIGQVTPVFVFTSGDEAELFLNDQSLGRKKKGQYEYRLRWDDVVYQPGTLKVVAYKNGKKWVTDEVKTAGTPAELELTPDRRQIQADGRDLSFITVTVTDAKGVMAPHADNAIHFDLEGPGRIVATDNGDPRSFEPFQSPDHQAFNGLCLVIVKGEPGHPGKIHLTARADGLKLGAATISTR